MKPERVQTLNSNLYKSGIIAYWMSREQRVENNWALIHTIEESKRHNTQTIVLFNLVPTFLEATHRQYYFMIEGLKELEITLKKHQIPFILTLGQPEITIPEYIKTHHIGELICDFSPLKIHKNWQQKVNEKIQIPFHCVDAHNILPCSIASGKQEFAAYTIRPKIQKNLQYYLDQYPKTEDILNRQLQTQNLNSQNSINWEETYKSLQINNDVKPIKKITPGENAAQLALQDFIKNKLENYSQRNDPTKDVSSNLSPYLHFGQISAQQIAQEVIKSSPQDNNQESFLEELIIRRELADNYCQYNQNYDTPEGYPNWAKQTLIQHQNDPREYLYTLQEFETAKTHDQLWNAAQNELIQGGKIHGYMRMYWAKKLLEWTKSVKEAQGIAIYLNDKYALDGRDPNGYTGIAWSLGGVHDRAWFERDIFGKIRYMSYNGCKSKFDINKYINLHK